MEDERRDALFERARATLQMLGIEGGVTVDVDYRADGFKARRL
jgi:protein-L-isoaspartate O-methyltransferase